jgi:hypothetical protein
LVCIFHAKMGISAVESPYPIFSPSSFFQNSENACTCLFRPPSRKVVSRGCPAASPPGKRPTARRRSDPIPSTQPRECVGAQPYSQRPNPARGVSAARCRRGYHQPIIVWKVVFSRPYGHRMRLRRRQAQIPQHQSWQSSLLHACLFPIFQICFEAYAI